MDSATLEKKLRQVQSMLAIAEHPDTDPHEAAAARSHAERLMAKYRIDEETARQDAVAKGIETIKPIVVKFGCASYASPYRDKYAQMLNQIGHHVGNVRMAFGYDNGEYVATIVGFESDVRYTETLYTALRLHFAMTLEPTYDPSLSDLDNVYRLRTAGIERPRIGEMMGWGRESAQRVTNVYKRACAARGEDPKVVGKNLNAKTYRESFARSYVRTIVDRLWAMRMTGADSGVLLLAGREAAVNEAYYTEFPYLRPITDEGRMLGEGTTGGPGGNCKKCNKASSRYCRDHAWLKPGAGKSVRVSSVGSAAGRSAANSADLGGSATRANKLAAGE